MRVRRGGLRAPLNRIIQLLRVASGALLLLLGDWVPAARNGAIDVLCRLKIVNVIRRVAWVEQRCVTGHVEFHVGLLLALDAVHEAVGAQLVAVVRLDVVEVSNSIGLIFSSRRRLIFASDNCSINLNCTPQLPVTGCALGPTCAAVPRGHTSATAYPS